jgi:DNA-binding NtrC family response regulator
MDVPRENLVMVETDTADKNVGHLIVVDDEEIVLTSLRSLLKITMDCDVECYTDPHQALDRIQHNSVDLVISDYLMPQMDGIAFLARVRDHNPEITRILLTAYADKESAVKAINEVGLFYYLEKPWDNNQLLLTIRNGLERRFLLRHLREKLSELDEAYVGLKETQRKLLKAFM